MTSLASNVSRRAILGGSLALSMGFSALHVSAQQGTGIIAGKITDTASAPVSNAMLHVVDNKYGAVSADNGAYRIEESLQASTRWSFADRVSSRIHSRLR
jgi:hypothetical protein